MDFDFLTNASADPYGYAGPQGAVDEFANTSGGAAIGDFFNDPNNQRLMADMGSRISQGQSAGQAIGDPVQANVRRKASQQAGGTLMEQILAALKEDPTGKKLLGPKEDKGTLDSITLDNKGMTFKAPNPDETMPFTIPGSEKQLEGIKNMSVNEPTYSDGVAGGSNLRDFLNPSQGIV